MTVLYRRHRPGRARPARASSARLPGRRSADGRDEQLRAKVRDAVAELDSIIARRRADGRGRPDHRRPHLPGRLPRRRGRESAAPPARLVDAKSREALAGLGTLCESRQLLFASLLLADQIVDSQAPSIAHRRPGPDARPSGSTALAERLESLADTLEKEGADA